MEINTQDENKFPPSKRGKDTILKYTIVFKNPKRGWTPNPWTRKRKFKSERSALQSLEAEKQTWGERLGCEIIEITLDGEVLEI